MTNKKKIQYIVISLLIVLPLIVFFLRRHAEYGNRYRWDNRLGINIDIPPEVRGPYGFNACLSPTTSRLYVVGNEIMPQRVLEEKDDPVRLMMALRHSFYYADGPDYRDFKEIYKSDYPSLVCGMACSPVSPDLVAFIANESRMQLPKSDDDILKVTNDPKLNKSTQNEFQQLLKTGCREVLYLLNASSGTVKELTVLSDRGPLKNLFLHLGGKNVSWTQQGDGLIFNDYQSLYFQPIDGSKQEIISLNGGAVFSNISCNTQGDISFVFFGEFKHESTINIPSNEAKVPRLVRIDRSGNLLSQSPASFFSGTYEFEIPLYALVGKESVLSVEMLAPNSLDSILSIQHINLQDKIVNSKTCSLSDWNNIQFYYQPVDFYPGDESVFLIKRRAVRGTEASPATPLSLDNMGAPWAELRKVNF